METTTETPEQSENGATAPEAEQPVPVPETSPAETQEATQMFRYSSYVHVGPGAEECEEGEDGSCANPLHFHGWCRLPNQFQNASIREKALAAKARKTRELHDPETDGSAVLDGEMDTLIRLGNDSDKELLVEDLLNQSYWKDHLTAVRELAVEEDAEGEKPWSTITEDQERFQHLTSLPEDQRPADEFMVLEKHMAAYEQAVTDKREELQKPQRDALEAKSVEELVKQIRESRIDAEANEAFMRTFSLWEWYIGTLKPRPEEKGTPSERVFGDVNHLQQAAPEVIDALERTFSDLEQAMGSRSAVGN